MAIDFPPVVTDPSQPWTNPDTGITYIYKDGAWRVISQSNIVDINDEFVNVSGDNMTGALTIGPAGSPVTTLANDGSATFAGQIKASRVTADPTLEGTRIEAIISNSTSTNIGCYSVYNKDTTITNFVVRADGSATFAGTGVFLGEYVSVGTPSINQGTGVALNNDTNLYGSIGIYSRTGLSSNPSSFSIFSTDSNDTTSQLTRKVAIYPNGSATFANDVQVSGFPEGGAAVGAVIRQEGVFQACREVKADGTDVIWAGYALGGVGATSFIYPSGNYYFAGTGNVRGLVFELEPENDAYYTTTTEEYTETETYTGPLGNTLEREVTKTRDIRTYTGPTLDVKERLTKADTALQTLKTAAAAAVDFAELKAAIATALADI